MVSGAKVLHQTSGPGCIPVEKFSIQGGKGDNHGASVAPPPSPLLFSTLQKCRRPMRPGSDERLSSQSLTVMLQSNSSDLLT